MVWGFATAVRWQGHMHWDDRGKVMEIEPMRGLTLSKFQIIMHGLDLGMGTESIGITASQRGRRCRIGIDTNIEAYR